MVLYYEECVEETEIDKVKDLSINSPEGDT